ncbi:hypothetical protein HanPSC8_Chr02g0061061 [Helianthus annuus]|nr:hypothetical protein HanPSC8_Chr02g0061061 [Helianthus annuus]
MSLSGRLIPVTRSPEQVIPGQLHGDGSCGSTCLSESSDSPTACFPENIQNLGIKFLKSSSKN